MGKKSYFLVGNYNPESFQALAQELAKHGFIPVSYTHLDVYKRQPFILRNYFDIIFNKLPSIRGLMTKDVYKRQLL